MRSLRFPFGGVRRHRTFARKEGEGALAMAGQIQAICHLLGQRQTNMALRYYRPRSFSFGVRVMHARGNKLVDEGPRQQDSGQRRQGRPGPTQCGAHHT